MSAPSIFAYVDGIPTKGCWVNLDETTTYDDVKEDLIHCGFCDEDYDGDILIADAEYLASAFLGDHGSFDFARFREFAALDADADAIMAYIDNYGLEGAEPEDFKERYRGEFDSKEDFAQEFFDDIHGKTILEAEQAGLRIDWEATARDLFTDGFTFIDGHVFSDV